MRLLQAIDAMNTALDSVGAPRRQRDGVAGWRADVQAAIACSTAFPDSPGLTIPSGRVPGIGSRSWRPGVAFVHGDTCHRAWRTMCKAIIGALRVQAACAADRYRHHMAEAEQARQAQDVIALTDPRWAEWEQIRVAALAWAQAAAAWNRAAQLAVDTGNALVRREDRISRPVGDAIAAAGGMEQVAQAKDYHQAGA
jgi:hypothetical protein